MKIMIMMINIIIDDIINDDNDSINDILMKW